MFRLIAALVCCLALPAGAEAQVPNCIAPPGTAAIDQYCELVTPPGRPSGSALARVDPVTVKALARSERGQRILRSIGPLGSGRARSTQAPYDSRTGSSTGRGPLGATRSAVGNAGTLGGGLVLVLVAVTIAMAIWFAAARRRRRSNA